MMSFRLGSPIANAVAYGAVWALLGLVLGVAINMLVGHKVFDYALSHAVPGAVAVGCVLAFTNYQQATRK
jgi:L-asparagine transporter-like permease